MKATRVLTLEHGLILKQLENLAAARRGLERGQRPPPAFFEKAVVFAREYADRFHHFKEEFLMFGLLAQKQAGELDTEIGALRHQHERCRLAMTAIERALPGYRAGDEIAATVVVVELAGYVALLRRHIHLEDDVFFPLAEKALSEEDDGYLMENFAEEARRHEGRDFTAECRRQVVEMGALVAVGRPGAPGRQGDP
jgi:hemerythrin-like domain-containing protein